MREADKFDGENIEPVSDSRVAELNRLIRDYNGIVPLNPIVVAILRDDDIQIELDETNDPRYMEKDGDYTDLYNEEVYEPVRRAMRIIFGKKEEDLTITGTYRSQL